MKAKPKVKKKTIGRPSKLKTINLEQLKFLVDKGCTDEEICTFFKISRSTFYLYQQTNKDFSDTIKAWKVSADDIVERSLFERAKGYTHKSEQVFCYLGKIKRATIIKQYPPDTVACIIWLKNRRPEVWRENPPAALDPLYQDAELEFIGVPSGKDPKFEKEMQQRFNNN